MGRLAEGAAENGGAVGVLDSNRGADHDVRSLSRAVTRRDSDLAEAVGQGIIFVASDVHGVVATGNQPLAFDLELSLLLGAGVSGLPSGLTLSLADENGSELDSDLLGDDEGGHDNRGADQEGSLHLGSLAHRVGDVNQSRLVSGIIQVRAQFF